MRAGWLIAKAGVLMKPFAGAKRSEPQFSDLPLRQSSEGQKRRNCLTSKVAFNQRGRFGFIGQRQCGMPTSSAKRKRLRRESRASCQQ